MEIAMLKSVKIHNFRLCRGVELTGLGSVVALVGRNGAGKTNILQAISMAANLQGEADVRRLFENIDVGLEFDQDEMGFRYRVTYSLLNGLQETLYIEGSDGQPIVDLRRDSRGTS